MTSAGSRTALESFLAIADGTAKAPVSRTDIAILAAAAAVISESGERNLTIDQVAERAGYTRMTVFRRFGNREQLLLSTYSHELRKVLDAVTAAANSTHTLSDRAYTVFDLLIAAAEGNPIFQRLAQVDPAAIVDLWRGAEFAGQTWGASLISHLLQDETLDRPLTSADGDFVGDLLMRLVVSLVLVPTSQMAESPDKRGAFLHAVVERALPH